MIPISFKLGSFGRASSPAGNKQILSILLEALTEINEGVYRNNRTLPGLYQSGVVYRREPIGQEDWQDIIDLYQKGYGDCEDLCCARAAELRVRAGTQARPLVKGPKKMPNGVLLYHIVVQYPDGTIEDPSERLGMGTRPEPFEHAYTIAEVLHA